LLAGQEVVWVPARLAAAHRRLHAATGAKSDPVDAAAAAHAAIATPGLDRHRIDERVRELRVLVDCRADLVKRRSMVINQLKAQLHLWLSHTPADLTRARHLAAITAMTSTAQLRPHVRRALDDMTAEIAGFNRHITGPDTTIRELVTPLAPALLQITGISYNSAAVLIAEIGDITRFPTSSHARRRSMFPDPVQREVFGVASPELSPHGLDIPSTPPATQHSR
jgi:transposase